MWALVARDRWVISAAFSTLIVVVVRSFFFLFFPHFVFLEGGDQSYELLLCGFHFQVLEISIPHFLTASSFTAQSANLAIFHRNVQLLILLCVASGICGC